MLVVEGIDGAGKTSLLLRLSGDLQIPVNERASKSQEGPVDNLWEWAERDVESYATRPVHLYDRHPLVSEYIYGPIVRGCIDPTFIDASARLTVARFHRHVLIIHCDPGLDVVRDNVWANVDLQMPGVVDHLSALYYAYRSYMTVTSRFKIVWNYTDSGDYERILSHCKTHLDFWEYETNV